MKKRLTASERANFLKQFATLLSAGLSLTQSCVLLETTQTHPALVLFVQHIQRYLKAGRSLADSFKQCPEHFNAFTGTLIRLGEQTGELETMLFHAATAYEKQYQAKQRLIKALFYPALIIIVASILTGILIFGVIPQFATLFQEANIPLPMLTRLIFNGASGLRQHGLLIFASIILVILLLRYKTPFQWPIISALKQNIQLAHFARHLSLTLKAGIPIHAALTLANTTTHPRLRHAITHLTQNLQAGMALHQAMALRNSFPTTFVQMVKIGEEGGILEEMVNKFADFIESDIYRIIEHFHLILEPFIMIMLGTMIGGLVIGLYLPLFQLGNTL